VLTSACDDGLRIHYGTPPCPDGGEACYEGAFGITDAASDATATVGVTDGGTPDEGGSVDAEGD
jgi:hypothetical protein